MKTTNPVQRALWKLGLAAHPRAHLVEREPSGALLATVTTTAPVQMKQPFALDQSYYDPTKYEDVTPLPVLVYARASYGAGYKDTMFVTHINGWRSRGVPVTAYHFFLYDESVRGQVDIFKAQIASAGGVSVLSYPVVLDIEGSLPAGVTAQQACDRLWGWIDAVNRELGVGVWIYSSANYLNYLRVGGKLPNWATYPDAITGAVRRYAIAGYPTDPNSFATMPAGYWPIGLSETSQKWLWQYTARLYVTGIQGAQDGNQELAHVPPSAAPVPPPTTEPAPTSGIRMQVLTATLSIRSGPGTSYPIVGTLNNSAIITAMDVSGNDAWVKIENGWVAVRVAPTTYLKKV